MTEKIYERNSYCYEFTAKVLECVLDNGVYNVILDKTCFFPEGGGQAADKGFIMGEEVIDVRQKDKDIIHVLKKPIDIGSLVSGSIDEKLRFSRMQSHTGEHIVSGIVHSMFGYDNIGFRMSDSAMTVDFSGPLGEEDIKTVEEKANRAIYKNAEITVLYPSKEEADKMDFRSKIEINEGLRVVNIDGVDSCACCAPHLKSTGEVGIVKIIDFYPYKKGTRVEMIAGINALNDYARLNNSNKALMKMLSAPRDAVYDAVGKMSEITKSLHSENQRLSRELAASSMKIQKTDNVCYSFFENTSYDDLRHCANSIIENGEKNCVLISKSDEKEYLYVVSSSENKARVISQSLNTAFNGKGGGKDNYCQGKIIAESVEEIKNAINRI